MATRPSEAAQPAAFTGSRDRFETVLVWLEGEQAAALSHGELEERLQVDVRELFRQLLQEHLDLRAQTETRIADVMDEARVPRPSAETGHARALATVFGGVDVRRIAYRRRGQGNLHRPTPCGTCRPRSTPTGYATWPPSKAHGAPSRSAVQAIERAIGQQLGKRQVEDLAARAAVDFDTSTPTETPQPARRVICWCCPVTARVS